MNAASKPMSAYQEAGGEQRDRAQQRCNGMRFLEELDRQDRGEAAENIEVVPLDDVSDRGGNDHGAEILRDFSSMRRGRCNCRHGSSPE
jgi:hypothetical protein